ncbi:MAG: proton-conducting transporter membrane subunit [Pseudomonadota bacterium]
MTDSLFLTFFKLSLAILLVGGALSLVLWRNNRLAHLTGAACSVSAALFGFIGSLGMLCNGNDTMYSFFWDAGGVPFSLRLDSLATFFLAPLFLLFGTCAVYAIRYLALPLRGLQAARHWSSFTMLGISMSLVVTGANSLVFLLAWELMSLSSFLLVVHDLEDEGVRKAGWIYFAATRLGTGFLFLLFLEEFYLTGSLDFEAFATLPNLPSHTVLLFFFLGLVGFGTKAGLFPMHGWLPGAHSAAPSHVSALMSGVMIKTAVYAFLRMVTFLPNLPSWCGLFLVVLGIMGALYGIAMASMQSDLKRSLAYSTVENIGIVFLALGVWLFCRNKGLASASTLALAGALLHIWNHCLFKGVLFLGAGSVLHATGTREMSSMGGLMRQMPMTGGLMVLGGAAISALPPFNGLIGELLIYLSLLSSGQSTTGATAFFFMLLVILLAMTGGMVLLTVTRIIGIIFSGEPRRTTVIPHEAPLSMIGAMLLPASLCLAIGIFPRHFLGLLEAPSAVLAPENIPVFKKIIATLPFGMSWSITCIVFLTLLGIVIRLRGRSRPRNAEPTWGCGYVRPSSRMAYTACGFTQFIQDDVYCSCLRPLVNKTTSLHPFPVVMGHVQQSFDPVLHRLFTPLFIKVADFAHSCRRLQAGQLGIYISYFFLTTILLLGWIIFSSQG